VILTCLGTLQDLSRYGIELKDQLRLTFYNDDADESGKSDTLIVEGVVQYDEPSKHWVAVIDWDSIKHESDMNKGRHDENN